MSTLSSKDNLRKAAEPSQGELRIKKQLEKWLNIKRRRR